MPNKAINEFNTVQSLNDNDIFLINQNDTTSTVRLSTIKNTILPSGTDGQVLTYDGSTNHWVASSFSVNVDNNFTGTNQLLSSDGYQEFPGGLIIQWGSTTIKIENNKSRSIYFKKPFPNNLFNVQVSNIQDEYTNDGAIIVYWKKIISDKQKVVIGTDSAESSLDINVSWLAIGN